MQVPVEIVAPVVGGMAVAIGALWRWGLKLSRRNEDLQQQLLNEKEEKVQILRGLKEEAERRRRKS